MADTPDPDAQWSKVISSTDRGALVSITAYLMLVGSLMSFGIRMCIRIPWSKLLGLDDYMTAVATCFALVHTVAILLSVKYGLGRHVSDILENDGYASLRSMSTAIYAGDFFLVLGISCSKLAVSLLFVRLASGRKHVLPAWILCGIIVVCGIFSFIAIAVDSPFRSVEELPKEAQPWPRSWIAIAALNVALEIALFAYPLYLVRSLQMALRSKVTVMVGFALRLPCSAIAVLRLVFLVGVSEYLPDISWAFVRPAIYSEIELHYSLIAATIPCMHIFLRHLNTGYLATTVDQYGGDSNKGTTNNSSYAMTSISRSGARTAHMDESLDAATAGFDFGDAFPKTNSAEQNTTSEPRSPVHDESDRAKSPIITEAEVTEGGWELRGSGCKGSTTTKIAHSLHASDGSVTSDGSDRIIIKKTVDVRFGSK